MHLTLDDITSASQEIRLIAGRKFAVIASGCNIDQDVFADGLNKR